MYTLGISGGFSTHGKAFLPQVPKWFYHDAAAALFKNGKLLYAAEEERFNRKKHTTDFPFHSISFCLEKAGILFSDIDVIGYYYKEDFVNNELNLQYIAHPGVPCLSSRQLLKQLLYDLFDISISDNKIVFLPHHYCHAFAACCDLGFDSALILVIDGRGGGRKSRYLFSKQKRRIYTSSVIIIMKFL